MNVGARLKELREQRNLSQNKLAQMSELSQGFVRQIELGEKNPTVDSVSKLCDGLGITLQEFFNGNIPPELTNPPEAKKPKDLDEFLRQQDIMFQGVPLSNEDKVDIRGVLEVLYKKAKVMNRRKGGSEK